MTVQEAEILSLHTCAADAPLRIGLLDGEPAGLILTRTAGAVTVEATLEWPPGEEGVSLAGLMPELDRGTVVGSLREFSGSGFTGVTGTLRSFEEENLHSVVDGALRVLSSTAAIHEAVLRARALRISRASYPEADVVQALARRLWASGLRVSFGASLSPAIPGTDVMLGCRNARGEIVESLAGY